MKHTLPILILFFSAISIQAQDILFATETGSVNSADTISKVEPSKDKADIIIHSFAINNKRSAIDLRWELTNFGDQPAGWQTAVCDNNSCYGPTTLTNITTGFDAPVSLGQGDSSVLDLHLYPGGIAGTGHAQICISTKSAPNDILGCLVYKFTVGDVSSSVETIEVGALEVFPNPTTEYFGLTTVSGVKEIQVYNMLGRKQRTYEAGLGKKYYVGDLPAGMYLIAFHDKDGKVLKTTRLVKRFYRP